MANVTELCRDLGSGDQVKAYHARLALTKQAFEAGALKRQENNDRQQLAAALATELKGVQPKKDGRGEATEASMTSVLAANDMYRLLALVAGDTEIPAIAAGLKNIDLREMARWSLERSNCQAATDAIVDALKTLAGQEFRVGLINALASKRGSNVTTALKECLDERDPQIQLAAAEALANQGDLAADEALGGMAKNRLGPRGQNRLTRARLRLASAAIKAGKKDGAKKILESIAADKHDETQAAAAKSLLAQL